MLRQKVDYNKKVDLITKKKLKPKCNIPNSNSAISHQMNFEMKMKKPMKV